MPLDPDATTIQPSGLGRTLLVITTILPVPATIVIILRCWVRLRHKIFGVDDALIFFGWLCYMCVTGIVVRSTYAGLGIRDVNLNAHLQNDGRKFLWAFQLTYCISLLFIKGSICFTLLRIAVLKVHRVIIWATLVLATLSTTVVIIGLLVICRPISAAWGHPGTCAPTVVLASLGYLVSSGAILTDWTCAILPGFMLYKVNMKRATKVSLTIILGLGVLASVATCIRFPYVKYYTRPDDYLYHCANIILWSIVESGIGITACSLPALKRLLKNHFQFDAADDRPPARGTPYDGLNRATITTNTTTGSRSAHAASAPWEGGIGWENLDDAEMGRQIFIKVGLERRSTERRTTSCGSRGSEEELVTYNAGRRRLEEQ